MAEINKIQFKRGTVLANAGTPAAGEPIVKTDDKTLYIGDGVTAATALTPIGTLNIDTDSASPTTILPTETLTFTGSGCTTSHTGNTVTITVSGAGTMDNFTVQGDSGTPMVVSNGETLDIGGDGAAITTSNATGTPEQLTISHTTTTGYKHIPSGGASGNILTWSADGTAVWSAPASGFPVADTDGIFQGSVDNTKQMKFEVDTNVATATTRTITMANQDIDLTPDTGTYASSGHIHNAFDRATSVLTGANVFSDIVVVDGITTGISTRALTASDVGAIPTTDTNIVRDNTTETISAEWTHATGGTELYQDNVNVKFGTGTDVEFFFNGTEMRTRLGTGKIWATTDSANADILQVSYTTNAADSVVDVANNLNVGGNAVITGNLTVNGTTTTVNSTVVDIADNFITLSSNQTGVTDVNSGITIERGDYTNASLYWDGTANLWKMEYAPDAATAATAYTIARPEDVTYENLNTNGDVGTGAAQVAAGNHTHTLQVVTDTGATTSNALTVTNATDATSSSTGALILSGGIGIAKSIYGAGSGTSILTGFAVDGGTF